MAARPKNGSFSDRAFRALMRLFPFEFRGEYQREMEGVFREQHADVERHDGFPGVLRLWWETLAGIFRTAPREHWEMLRQDGGYALRMMAQQPGYTAIALLTLALGIGSNTAIFSMVYGVILRPLPYHRGQDLVLLSQEFSGAGGTNEGFSVKEIADYRQQNRTLEALVEYHSMSFDLVGHGEPQRVQTGVVSPEYFDFLGLQPEFGRFFSPDDDKPGAAHVLVLTHGYWVRHMGSDPEIVGKVLSMNGRAIRVIGVLPSVPLYPGENDVYMPPSACPFRSDPKTIEDRGDRMMTLFARLKPGVTLEQSNADLAAIASRLAGAYPEFYPPASRYTARSQNVQALLAREAKTKFLLLLGAASMVLLIACANVANLTLSRLLRRERELAVRAAMGAGPVRLLRQLITESTLLALGGGALGLLFARAGLSLLMRFAERFTPRAGEIRLDGTVLLYTAAIAMLTGIVFGALPAMATGRNPADTLHGSSKGAVSGGKHRNRLRALLVVSQVAVSFTLLVGAGLMLHSLYNLQHVDAGFRPQNVLTMFVDLDWSRYMESEKATPFFDKLLTRVGAMSGVIANSVSIHVPLNDSHALDYQFEIEGRPAPSSAERPRVSYQKISPNFFRTIGTPLVRGRNFQDTDTGDDSTQVAIINQTMARHYWPNEDPLGHRISFDNGENWITIVGIASDIREFGLDKPPDDEIFRPFAQSPWRMATLLVRTADDPMKIARRVTEAVYEIDPGQAVARVRTLEEIREDSLGPTRLIALLLALFGGLALAITAAGLAGVMALSVSQRTQEIGIRMALGATPGSIFRMVLGQGLGLVALGVVIGAAGGVGLARVMSTLLFGVQPADVFTLAGVVVVLLAIAAVACFIPARRAAVVDPLVALRYE